MDLTEAYDKASGEKTPWNPSRSATARVTDALPAPTVCRYCGGAVHIVNNEVVYGRPYGDWPWMYRCEDDECDAYVGMHPFTALPLGTLANAQLREKRKLCKVSFNLVWQGHYMKRREAYAWLAEQLGISKSECHFGLFEVDTCMLADAVCLSYLEIFRS